MAIFILLAFIIVPLVEIGIFVQVGSAIGLWNTLACVILTAVVGTWLLRAQGMMTLRRAQESFARQEFPMKEVFDGLCLLVAGALLLTPGFATDGFGLLLFVPPFRALIRGWVWRRLSGSAKTGIWVDGDDVNPPRDPPQDSRWGHGDDRTIDGEYHEVDPNRGPPGGNRLP